MAEQSTKAINSIPEIFSHVVRRAEKEDKNYNKYWKCD